MSILVNMQEVTLKRARTEENTELTPPCVFSVAHHWSFEGVTMVFGCHGSGKSSLARALVQASRAERIVSLGGAFQGREGSVTAQADSWDAAQQLIGDDSAATTGVLLVVDAFHGDCLIEKVGWLRNYVLGCRSRGNGVIFVFDSPFYLGKLLSVVRLCTRDIFVGKHVSQEEGRRLKALLASVNDDINTSTKQLLDFVCRSEHMFLHVNTESLDPETRFHIVQE